VEPTLEAVAVLACLIPFGVIAVTHPSRTILPLYAAFVPVGGVFALAVPLPSPFNSVTSLLGGAAIGAIIAHVILYREGRIPTIPVAAWLWFVAWCALTLLWADDRDAGLRELQTAVPLVLLLVTVGIIVPRDGDLGWMRVALAVGGAAIGVYALGLVLSGSGLPSQGVGDRFSLGGEVGNGNPNQLAAALLLPLLAGVDMAIDPARNVLGRAERPLGVVSVVLIGVAIALSGSRGGVVAGSVALVAAALLYRRWRPELRPAVRVAAVATAMTMLVLVITAVLLVTFLPNSRITATAIDGPVARLVAAETGASGRGEIWSVGLLACRQHCAVGVGLGNFARAYTDAFPFSAVSRNVGVQRPAHNMYLDIGVESGIVGFALFGVALTAEFRVLRRNQRRLLTPALGAAIVGLLVAHFFEGFLWFKHAWLPFVVIRILEATSAGGKREVPRVADRAERPLAFAAARPMVRR
jgi:O-antigen ligase